MLAALPGPDRRHSAVTSLGCGSAGLGSSPDLLGSKSGEEWKGGQLGACEMAEASPWRRAVDEACLGPRGRWGETGGHAQGKDFSVVAQMFRNGLVVVSGWVCTACLDG